MRNRRWRWTAALGAVTLVATACIGGGGGQTQEPAEPIERVEPPTEETTITFSSWIGESPEMKKFVKDFEEEYPTITVELQNVPAERSREKLLTQVAGGNPPDAAYVDLSVVEDFGTRGALVNLDSYIAQSDVIDTNDYVPAFDVGSKVGESYYGLPFDGESTGLFYRTDLFEQAGLDGPPATWEEFEAAAQALTDPANKQYGFILFAPESAYYWYPWLWQAGGDTLSEDGQEIAFDSPEGVEAAEFYVGLREYSPPDFLASNSWDGRVAFATGQVAMYEAGAWFAGTLASEFPEIDGKWATAPLPEGDAGCATTIAGDDLVLFDTGDEDKQNAAWLWIEFLSRPENMAFWTFESEFGTLLPPRRSLLEDPALIEKKPILEGFTKMMECGVVSTVEQPKWPEVEAVLNEELGAAIYGDISAEEAIQNAAEEGQEIISG